MTAGRFRILSLIVPAGLALACFGCSAENPASAHATTPAAAPKPVHDQAQRYVHQIDVGSLVKGFLTPQGMLDPEASAAVAVPSPYFTDFFGVQALADTTREKLLKDFVPEHATEVARGDHSITLKFRKGYTAEFFPNSSVSVMGTAVPSDHATISGDDWRTRHANLADLISIIQSAGLAADYLVTNPYYVDEQATQKQILNGKPTTVKVDPDLAAFDASTDAVLLFPEGVHGIDTSAQQLTALMGKHKLGWLGMEMLNTDMQEQLDAFNAAKAGTPQYQAERAKLVAYFANAWNGRAGPKTTGEENYYFKLVEAAHAQGVRVVALESASMAFILFRYGETPFGGAVRSYQWAKAVPATGRGAVFGGSAHYNLSGNANVQDFIAARSPGRLIVSTRDLFAKNK